MDWKEIGEALPGKDMRRSIGSCMLMRPASVKPKEGGVKTEEAKKDGEKKDEKTQEAKTVEAKAGEESKGKKKESMAVRHPLLSASLTAHVYRRIFPCLQAQVLRYPY